MQLLTLCARKVQILRVGLLTPVHNLCQIRTVKSHRSGYLHPARRRRGAWASAMQDSWAFRAHPLSGGQDARAGVMLSGSIEPSNEDRSFCNLY
jgi:hypothetical protein